MLRNYLITAYRNIVRHKLYSLINIGGLAIGLAVCILIFLFVKDELTYDDWGPETDQIYRLEAAYKQNEGDFPFSSTTPGKLRDSLIDNYNNEIISISRFRSDKHILKQNDDVFEEKFTFVDEQVFEIFNIEMVSGNRSDIFRDNQSVIINQFVAAKYFGDSDPIGQILSPADVDYAFKVVGVMKDLPENTHLDFSFLAMFDTERYINRPGIAELWLASNVHTYIKFAIDVSVKNIEASLPNYLDRNVVRSEQPGLIEDPSNIFRLRLMPVSDIHLYSLGGYQMKPGGDIKIVYSFAVIALLILFIASINFINLSTARASMRAREIALRKVVGASRHQLIIQFLGEAFLMVLLALIIALTIIEFTLPLFNDFVTKLLSLDYGSDPMTGIVIMGLLVVVGIGAGIQPAVQITRVRPAAVLRANKSSSNAGSKLRVVLVTIQFAISIGLISTTAIVYSQTKYASSKDLGFETLNRITLENMDYYAVKPLTQSIKQEIENLPGVIDASYSDRAIPFRNSTNAPFQKIGINDDNTYALEHVDVDSEFLNFLDARVIAGRVFGDEFLNDAASPRSAGEDLIILNTVLNRAAVKHLNLGSPEEAVGQTIIYKNSLTNDDRNTQMTVVGVVEDMNLRSLKDEADPITFRVSDDNYYALYIHIKPEDQLSTLSAINSIWKNYIPALPIDLSYMNDSFNNLYEADAQRGIMFGYFSIFAVIVSCLGLFGLSSFTAEQKTKEIGVRKVFGARNSSIIRLLVWQFSKPVLIANIIAWPVAWYIMQDWLSGFAYRIDMTIIPFLSSGLIALIIAWTTIILHSWRVARMNPIHALRHE